jgi:hypothetical protein
MDVHGPGRPKQSRMCDWSVRNWKLSDELSFQPNRMAFRARRVTRLSKHPGAVATTPHHAYGSGGSSPDPISGTMMNWLRSRTCEGRRRIHRAHVRGRPGTRICRGDFMVRCPTYANHRALCCSWGEMSMSHGWNRAEHYRDLAEELWSSRRNYLINPNEMPLLADGRILQHVG